MSIETEVANYNPETGRHKIFENHKTKLTDFITKIANGWINNSVIALFRHWEVPKDRANAITTGTTIFKDNFKPCAAEIINELTEIITYGNTEAAKAIWITENRAKSSEQRHVALLSELAKESSRLRESHATCLQLSTENAQLQQQLAALFSDCAKEPIKATASNLSNDNDQQTAIVTQKQTTDDSEKLKNSQQAIRQYITECERLQQELIEQAGNNVDEQENHRNNLLLIANHSQKCAESLSQSINKGIDRINARITKAEARIHAILTDRKEKECASLTEITRLTNENDKLAKALADPIIRSLAESISQNGRTSNRSQTRIQTTNEHITCNHDSSAHPPILMKIINVRTTDINQLQKLINQNNEQGIIIQEIYEVIGTIQYI